MLNERKGCSKNKPDVKDIAKYNITTFGNL
jgi:hypothetical protein